MENGNVNQINNHINLLNNLFRELNSEIQITNQTDNENKRTSEEFIQSLNVIQNETPNLTCSLCLEEIDIGEECISLPCKDNKHIFHTKNDNCPGILSWLKKSNTCPICRHEFPVQESSSRSESMNEETDETTNETTNEQEVINIDDGILIRFINYSIRTSRERFIREEENRQLEAAIQASLEEQ